MNRRIRRWLFLVPLALFAAIPAAWFWLLHTESGARWLFDRAAGSIPATLQADRIGGDLGSGLRLEGLIYDDGGIRVEAMRVLAALDIDLLPPAVYLDPLRAEGVEIQLQAESGPPAEEPAEIDPESILGSLSLPLPVHLDGAAVSGLAVYNVEGDRMLAVDAIEVSGSLHRSLVLDRASLAMADHRFSASARLGLQAPWPVGANLVAAGEYAFTAELGGSLESLSFGLAAPDPVLRAEGTVESLLDRPEWVLSVTAPRLQWPLEGEEPDVLLADAEISGSGTLEAFNLDLSAEVGVEGLEPSTLRLSGDGSDTGFTVRRLVLDGPELALEAAGGLAWKEQFSLALETVLHRLDAGHWVAGWPDENPVQGALDVHWSGGDLEVPRLELSVQNTSFTASGNAVVDLESGVVQADLAWKELSWPPGSPAAEFASEQGAVRISGNPDEWTVDGEFAFQAGDYPDGSLRLNGAGDRESMDLEIVDGNLLGGSISGRLVLGWTGNQPFEARLGALNIHTEPLYPAAPAVLNAELTAGGTLNPLAFSAVIQRIDGTVAGHPVTLDGGIHYETGQIRAERLSLRSGESALSLDGSLQQPEGMAFNARIEALSRFDPALAGSIQSEGMLSLDPDSPALLLAISGQQLRLGQLEIAKIESREPPSDSGGSGFEIVFTGLKMDQRGLDTLSLSHTGLRPLEDIAFDAAAGEARARLRLTGAVNDWSDPLESGWSGSLAEFLLAPGNGLSLSLEQPAAVDWRAGEFRLDPACLGGTGDSRLCLETATWRSADDFAVAADIAALPLSLAELFLVGDVRFNQVLSGKVDWSRSGGLRQDGAVLLELSPGTITLEDEVMLETGPGLFAFELTRGTVQRGRLDIGFPGAGTIDIDFNVPDLDAGPDSRIQGTALADLNDLGILGVAFPVFDTTGGVLDVDLELLGTLADPSLDGTIRLKDGHIEDTASGFSFRNIDLTGKIDTTGRADLQGTFRAGEGDGTIHVTALFDDFEAPNIRMDLQGESLTLVDVPDLKLVADPDIQLGWNAGEVEVGGRIDIPTVRFSPSYLPRASIRESEDVTVVAGERPGELEGQSTESDLRIHGNLEVALGDSVLVDLDVAKIDVTGATRFNWQGDAIPIANGGFNLQGEIQAFGQFLRLTRGRIGFPDIPADNPQLNIRAEREIFGNAQIRRAGLMIAGTLKRPIVEPYTVPMTTKERAQTLLITGSDFDYEQGVGAVDVGMYVLPRLYVSYGIGVFEEGNVLRARFDLGRGFGIRATSGQRETGLDISYTLER